MMCLCKTQVYIGHMWTSLEIQGWAVCSEHKSLLAKWAAHAIRGMGEGGFAWFESSDYAAGDVERIPANHPGNHKTFPDKTFFTADFPRHSVQHLASEVLTWRVVVGWGQNKNKECYKSSSFLRNIIFSIVRSFVRYNCLLCDSGRTGQKRSRQYFCMPYNAIQYNSIVNTSNLTKRTGLLRTPFSVYV